ERPASDPLVSFQALTEADAFFDLVAQASIELDYAGVARTSLKVDLRTAEMAQAEFRLRHQEATEAFAAMLGRDGEMVYPAAEPIEAGDDSCNQRISEFSDEKQVGLGYHFTADHHLRVVPRRVIVKRLTPEGGNANLIAGFIRANDEALVRH